MGVACLVSRGMFWVCPGQIFMAFRWHKMGSNLGNSIPTNPQLQVYITSIISVAVTWQWNIQGLLIQLHHYSIRTCPLLESMPIEKLSKDSVSKDSPNLSNGQTSKGPRAGPATIPVPRDQRTQQRASEAQQNYSDGPDDRTEAWLRYQDQHGPYHALDGIAISKTSWIIKETSTRSGYVASCSATQGSSKRQDRKIHGEKSTGVGDQDLSSGK
ncbi:hypothetical protein GGR52DRAFT_347345 [Hypoxylon sp. FL1284]|nr:hypothetical protein GGR52DRAFT_347345 [Hypoxylon sp. FL1284]